jgi:hypothetical protein
MPQPGTASCTVRFEFYRSQSSTPRIAEETDRYQPRGAGLAICRHGRPLTAAQFASEMMELFFEGV